MEISSISSQLPSLEINSVAKGKNLSPQDTKIADSCKQFEAVLWRQMLEKALEPMLHSFEGGGDKTGTYNYFLSNTLSDAVSGGAGGISSLLQAQLIGKKSTSSNL
jgi:hypothetical protein